MTTIERETTQRPAWWDDMEFCHISDDGSSPAYCGAVEGNWTCEDYDGEAICPTCGLPTCPRCAQLAALTEAAG